LTDFTKTISNDINCFGIEPSNKWGAIDWGDDWGEGANDLICHVLRTISNSVTPSWDLNIRFTRTISLGSIAGLFDMGSQYLTDPNGYYRLFQGNVTDANERSSNVFAEQSDPDDNFTSLTAASTTWTES